MDSILQESRTQLGLFQIRCVLQVPRAMGILAIGLTTSAVIKKTHTVVLRSRSAATLLDLDTFVSGVHRGAEQSHIMRSSSEMRPSSSFIPEAMNEYPEATDTVRTQFADHLAQTQGSNKFLAQSRRRPVHVMKSRETKRA